MSYKRPLLEVKHPEGQQASEIGTDDFKSDKRRLPEVKHPEVLQGTEIEPDSFESDKRPLLEVKTPETQQGNETEIDPPTVILETDINNSTTPDPIACHIMGTDTADNVSEVFCNYVGEDYDSYVTDVDESFLSEGNCTLR